MACFILVQQFHHSSCSTFIKNTSCIAQPDQNYTGCPGGCGDPDSCVNCAMRYTSTHDGHKYYQAPYICTNGLEQVREICNATVRDFLARHPRLWLGF